MARTREEAIAYLTAQREAKQAAQPKRTRSEAIAWLTEQKNKTNASQQARSEDVKTPTSEDVKAPASEAPEESNLLNDPIRTIGRSVIGVGSDMIQPLLHPLDTIDAVGNLAGGVLNKFTPGVQENEAMVDAIGDHYSERYGGLSNIGNTLLTDPAGMLLDASGILTGGGSLAAKIPGMAGKAGKMTANIGKAIDPVNMAGNTVGAAKKAMTINPNKAQDLMKSAVKFSTTYAPEKVNKMVGTMLDHNIVPNEKGLAAFDSKLAGFADNVDSLISNATEQGVKIKRSSIMNGIQDLKNSMTDIGNADSVGNLKKIDKTVKEWAEPFKDTKYITPEEAQKLKRNLYKDINFDKSNFAAKIAKEETKTTLASGARRALEKAVPGIETQNKGYGDLLELQKPLHRAAQRIGNRDVGGIGAPIRSSALATLGGGLGYALGGAAGAGLGASIGSGIGYLGGFRDLPITKAKRALRVNALQKGSYADVFTKNNGLIDPAVNQGLLQGGRINGLLDDEQ